MELRTLRYLRCYDHYAHQCKMSLLKIPCMLIAMIGLHITATAPQPPARPEDTLLLTNRMERFMKLRFGPLAVKVGRTCILYANANPIYSLSVGRLQSLRH